MWQNISNALRARRKFRIAFHLQKEKYKLHPYVHCKEIQVERQPNGPSRSSKISHFQNEVMSKTFLVKLRFYLHENRKRISFISIASHLASLRNWAQGQLGNYAQEVRQKFVTRLFTKPSGSDKLQISCNVNILAFSWFRVRHFVTWKIRLSEISF